MYFGGEIVYAIYRFLVRLHIKLSLHSLLSEGVRDYHRYSRYTVAVK
jgi:hypothetical protein